MRDTLFLSVPSLTSTMRSLRANHKQLNWIYLVPKCTSHHPDARPIFPLVLNPHPPRPKHHPILSHPAPLLPPTPRHPRDPPPLPQPLLLNLLPLPILPPPPPPPHLGNPPPILLTLLRPPRRPIHPTRDPILGKDLRLVHASKRRWMEFGFSGDVGRGLCPLLLFLV